jgi:hypothetical protein
LFAKFTSSRRSAMASTIRQTIAKLTSLVSASRYSCGALTGRSLSRSCRLSELNCVQNDRSCRYGSSCRHLSCLCNAGGVRMSIDLYVAVLSAIVSTANALEHRVVFRHNHAQRVSPARIRGACVVRHCERCR